MSTAEGEGGKERFFLYRLPNKCFFFIFLSINHQPSIVIACVRNDIESKSPIVGGPPRGTALQRSATLPANPKLAKRPVPWRVRSPSTDQVCIATL